MSKPEGTSYVMVFKTSLQTPAELLLVSNILDNIGGIEEWSIDLDDWEKILRIRSSGITAEEVNTCLGSVGIRSKEIAKEPI